MAYWAGWPVPSSTSVNASVTEESVVLATARSNTVPGGTGLPAVTVTAAVPLCPSLVALIVTAPAPAPVTSPVEGTVATAGVLDSQVTDRPESTLPAASFSVAVSCTVAPTSTTAVTGLITTDATGTFATVTLADPLLPSLVAVIVTAPAATPITRPLADTVAIAVFELVHVTARPASTFPAASLGVALSCVVAPTNTVAVAGLTVTDATGTLEDRKSTRLN